MRASAKKRSRWPLGPRRPTLGPHVAAWMEANLCHGEGDYYGRPFRLRDWQEDLLNQAYELLPDGTRRYDRVLAGLPKGNGKSELAGAIAVTEFAGPVVFDGWDADGSPKPGRPRGSPDIPVAAASFDQANLVFGVARAMIRGGRLADHCEVYESEILLKGRPGRLYKVPAVAGTNDGARPTFFVADELHEWTGNKERVYTVLEAGRAKRAEAWQLAITTAGWDTTSLLGKLYAHGKRVVAGEVPDPRFLFVWREAAEHWDLSDPAQLEAAVREANPAAGDFLPLDNIVRQFTVMPAHEARRYYLNQWVAAPTQWIPTELWAAAARPGRAVPEGVRIMLGFDGSYNRDATALVGVTVEEVPHLLTLGVWERPAQATADWSVPREDVLGAIEDAIAHYEVTAFGFDDTFGRMWHLDLEALARKKITMLEWPTRSPVKTGPAAAAFYGALKDGRLTHDGDPRLTAHIAHCVTKGSRYGLVPVKESQDSPRHIDAAIAALIAYDLVVRGLGKKRSVYEDRDLISVDWPL